MMYACVNLAVVTFVLTGCFVPQKSPVHPAFRLQPTPGMVLDSGPSRADGSNQPMNVHFEEPMKKAHFDEPTTEQKGHKTGDSRKLTAMTFLPPSVSEKMEQEGKGGTEAGGRSGVTRAEEEKGKGTESGVTEKEERDQQQDEQQPKKGRIFTPKRKPADPPGSFDSGKDLQKQTEKGKEKESKSSTQAAPSDNKRKGTAAAGEDGQTADKKEKPKKFMPAKKQWRLNSALTGSPNHPPDPAQLSPSTQMFVKRKQAGEVSKEEEEDMMWAESIDLYGNDGFLTPSTNRTPSNVSPSSDRLREASAASPASGASSRERLASTTSTESVRSDSETSQSVGKFLWLVG